MTKRIEGKLTVDQQNFALVVSRFNDFITSRLVGGAVDTLLRHGCADDHITTIMVPGAFEIPFTAKKAAESGGYDAIICLGCVIRGQTPHFDFIASQAARGVAQVALDTGIPVTFGLITADTLEQAIERAGAKAGNKGADAAAGAIEMVNLVAALPTGQKI